MKYCWYFILRTFYWLRWRYYIAKQWIWCVWKHKKHRCYPMDHVRWHCHKCTPCGRNVDEVFKFLPIEPQWITNRRISKIKKKEID
jgi:hypothetical protein